MRLSKFLPKACALRAGCAAACLALSAPSYAANDLNGIRLHDAPDSTRVVLDTREAASYELFAMSRPNRIVIDLRNTRAADLDVPTFDSSVVKRIRHARRGAKNLRVVLDLKREATAKEFALRPIPPYGHRLVVDLRPPQSGDPPPPPRAAPEGKRDVVWPWTPGTAAKIPAPSASARSTKSASCWPSPRR